MMRLAPMRLYDPALSIKLKYARYSHRIVISFNPHVRLWRDRRTLPIGDDWKFPNADVSGLVAIVQIYEYSDRHYRRLR